MRALQLRFYRTGLRSVAEKLLIWAFGAGQRAGRETPKSSRNAEMALPGGRTVADTLSGAKAVVAERCHLARRFTRGSSNCGVNQDPGIGATLRCGLRRRGATELYLRKLGQEEPSMTVRSTRFGGMVFAAEVLGGTLNGEPTRLSLPQLPRAS